MSFFHSFIFGIDSLLSACWYRSEKRRLAAKGHAPILHCIRWKFVDSYKEPCLYWEKKLETYKKTLLFRSVVGIVSCFDKIVGFFSLVDHSHHTLISFILIDSCFRSETSECTPHLHSLCNQYVLERKQCSMLAITRKTGISWWMSVSTAKTCKHRTRYLTFCSFAAVLMQSFQRWTSAKFIQLNGSVIKGRLLETVLRSVGSTVPHLQIIRTTSFKVYIFRNDLNLMVYLHKYIWSIVFDCCRYRLENSCFSNECV